MLNVFVFFPFGYLSAHALCWFFIRVLFLAAKTKIKGRSSEVIVLNLNQILPPLTSTVPLSLIFHFWHFKNKKKIEESAEAVCYWGHERDIGDNYNILDVYEWRPLHI